jgi:hypothetical protein
MQKSKKQESVAKNKKSKSNIKPNSKTTLNKTTKIFKTANHENKPIKNKNSYVGRTYRMQDDDLPHNNQGSGKIVNVAVVDENRHGEMAVVRLSTKNTQNAKKFKTQHRLYKGYKTFVEIQFKNNDSIKPSDKRLKENPWLNNLTRDNLNEMRDTLYNKSKQAKTNKEKVYSWKK